MNLKLQPLSNKKAYIQIDFIIAVFIFFMFFITVYMNFIYEYQNYDTVIDNSFLESSAIDICKVLTNSEGFPNNWETNISSLKILGLLENNKSYLSSSKVLALNNSNLVPVLDSLLISDIVYINILGVNSKTNYAQFGVNSNGKILHNKMQYNCYANYNNLESVRILVEVWR